MTEQKKVREVTIYAESGKRRRVVKCIGFELHDDYEPEIGERVRFIELSAVLPALKAAEFAQTEFEAIHYKGFRHLTAWQKLRDSLAPLRHLLKGDG